MDFKTDIPIYIQIATQVKEQIMSGTLKDGCKLPSVREYSVIYEVSPLTVQRAIQQLDFEGVLQSKKGIGSFVVNGCREKLEEQMIGSQVQLFIEKMKNMGLSKEDIVQVVRRGLENE